MRNGLEPEAGLCGPTDGLQRLNLIQQSQSCGCSNMSRAVLKTMRSTDCGAGVITSATISRVCERSASRASRTAWGDRACHGRWRNPKTFHLEYTADGDSAMIRLKPEDDV